MSSLREPSAQHSTIRDPRPKQWILGTQQVSASADSSKQYRRRAISWLPHRVPSHAASARHQKIPIPTHTNTALPRPCNAQSATAAPTIPPRLRTIVAVAPYVVIPRWIIYRIGTDAEGKENRTDEEEKTTHLGDFLHIDRPVHHSPPLVMMRRGA